MIRPVTKKKGTQKITAKIGDEMITESENERLLGIDINNKLTSKNHISNLIKKSKYNLSIVKDIVRRYRDLCTKNLIILAEGIFTSSIRYGMPVFGHKFARLNESEPKKKLFPNCKCSKMTA